jgi:acetolactate synthase-1/2/3 large subunit
MTTVATALIDGLVRLGVERIFTLSGNQILSLYDACIDAGIKLTDTRHEAAAGHMAEAWARLRGVPGVCLVSAGPGHTNAVTAMANAAFSETPVLWLSGASDARHAGAGGFQEIDQVGLAAPICKDSRALQPGESPAELLAWAWRTMLSGTPGPVHLSLPADLLGGATEALPLDPRAAQPAAWTIDSMLLDDVARSLATAQRPVVLASPSVGRSVASATLNDLWRRAGIPTFVLESPRGLTDPALRGRGAVTSRADVVLLLAPVDYAVAFAGPRAVAPTSHLIHVAPNVKQGGRARPTTHERAADGAALLDALAARDCGLAEQRTDWLSELASARTVAEARYAEAAKSNATPIHPFRLVQAVREALPAGSLVSIDGGEFAQWARWGMAGSESTMLVNGKFGMLGPAVPFAIAARQARLNAVSVAFVGDGTAGYHLLEIDTAVRHGTPILVVVGNDAGWAAERHRQLALYGPDRLVAADLLPTRYDQVVTALGGHGEFVTAPEAIGPAIERALASGKPACLNVMIDSVPSPADPV